MSNLLPQDGVALWRHQEQLIALPKLRRDIEFFFMVAGYGSGKSFAGVMLIIDIARQYQGKRVVVGVGGGTITLLRKTLLADLFRICMTWGVPFTYNKNEEIVTIGTVSFVIISTESPERIYAYNFSIFICDEIDELPQVKALEAFKAIQERTRITLPDGRVPFSVFMTTAQGYRGTYQIVSELKERGIPYRLIHGKTADNLALPRAYVKRLYSIYNEVERRVFLEGQFANLTTGRVYYGYDEEKHRLKEFPFTVEPNDLIRVGQDFNFGYSCGTAIVKREGKLYVVKLWSFAEIGHAAKMIRTDFPNNVIEWYPDASAPEIVAGIAKEFRNYDIQIRIGTINPSVVDRIFFVNHLFEMSKLFLFPNCGPLSMALKVRQFDDKGDPEKGKGPTAPDHRCFVAGTKVMTNAGEIPIELIIRGQKVQTRKGFHRVTASGMTGIREVQTYKINGHELRCTPDHPIWTGSEFKAASLFAQGLQPATVPVYNLTVESEHEFFANGILVSNCDSLEYDIWRIVSRDTEFLDLWTSTRAGRRDITDRKISA